MLPLIYVFLEKNRIFEKNRTHDDFVWYYVIFSPRLKSLLIY